MAKENQDILAEFETRKSEVVGFAEQLRALSVERGENDAAQVLDGFMKRFRETRFLTVVVGDFKSGKSTFVNALVGRNVCPVKATPRTAKITRLSAVPKEVTGEYALIHFREDRDPERVAFESVALDDLVAHKGARTETVRHVDLFLYAGDTILRRPLILVDTPGLGSGEEEHSQITRNYMQHADALIFLFSATKPFSETERDFLLSFRSLIPRTLFVVNQADRIPEEERTDVLQHIGESLKASVLGAETPVPRLFLVSARLATLAHSAHDEAALKSSGLMDLVEALEQTLARDHGAPLLRGIVSQQKDVCGGLLHQALLAKEALSADRTARATFDERRATLQSELDRLRAEKTDITASLHGVRSVMLDRVAQEAGRVNQQILAGVAAWIQECPSEDVCRKDLAAVLSKILSDRLELFDNELRKAYGQLADHTCQRVTKTLAAMEHRTRDILAPGERTHVRDDDRLRRAAAALTGLDAVASGIGGPTGGYGVAGVALNKALVPSPAAQVLSVAAAVGFLVAAVSGVGWVVAGIGGLLAAIFGMSHSSSWRERVTREVAQRLQEDVFPKVTAEAAESVSAFFQSLGDEVAQHIDDVHRSLGTIVTRVSLDYTREEQQRKNEVSDLEAFFDRARALGSAIDRFLDALPPEERKPDVLQRRSDLLPPSEAPA